MNLLRIILIAAAIWIVYTIISNYLKKKTLQRQKQPPKVGNMVRCNYCGLHIPEMEATRHDDDYYCSEEHSKLSVRDE